MNTGLDEPFRGVIGRTIVDSTPWWPSLPAPPPGAPNVVVIVLDDYGFSHLGCFGSDIATPHIDRLAAGGLRYSNFHVTPMCSPTRASLLTGRNHHSVGVASIIDLANGFPNNRGFVSRNAGMLPEYLRSAGYNTMAIGKWHLAAPEYESAAGPYDHWPLGSGFERYYGFLGAFTDQWHPDLVEDNHRVVLEDRPRPAGYHLTTDLVDHAISYLRDQRSVAPSKPFFLYLALGAGHVPHQVPEDYVERYRGRYDRGWDVVREEWFARQRELGIVPPDAELPQRNPGDEPWESIPVADRAVYARMQEVFAGFLTHADAELGRLVDELTRLGDLDNTLILLLSDNGASHEGGLHGTANNLDKMNGVIASPHEIPIDLLGTEQTSGHYPQGWATVGNTPLKRWKRYTDGGGVRSPLIVHWPAGVAARGEVCAQFHHVTDLMPTVMDAAGIVPPPSLHGVEQMPVHGTSLRYTFDDPTAPTRKHVQYFELLGNRGIWLDGWKAVSRHDPARPLDDGSWELYHLDSDFSENRDLAVVHPGVLRRLIDRWWLDAEENGVFPIDDRFWERTLDRPADPGRVRRFVYYQGIQSVPSRAAPDVRGKNFSISASFHRGSERQEGVIIAQGGRFGGYSLFVQDNALVFESNCAGRRYVLRSGALPVGDLQVSFVFDVARGRGTGRLGVGGQTVASGEMRFLPLHAGFEPLDVGRDTQTPVSDAYACPFAFAGTLERVVVEVEVVPVAHESLAADLAAE